MKVTHARIVTLTTLIVSGLLLVLAASCSFFEPSGEAAVKQQRKEVAVEQPAKQEPAETEINPPPFVANPFCHACHADFEEEELVVTHLTAGVGCERCHGESERHRSDEANITPPEIMYPRTKIIPMCMMCHPREGIERVQEHKTFLAGAETIFDEEQPKGPAKVCTDCHAQKHRMNVRIVRWDKATGEILEE